MHPIKNFAMLHFLFLIFCFGLSISSDCQKIENSISIQMDSLKKSNIDTYTSLTVTPAMATGLTKRFISIEEIDNLMAGESPKKEIRIKEINR